ncbi:terpene synthase family protein [Actinocorallia longicatena]|uniref:Terpene synthase n=1 Tax=Actinocorallia longicatena TaxID=111803 RepID=A0ABP6PYX1_9ACTN
MTADALSAGRICAVAGQVQREMQGWARRYPELYKAEAFDPALFSSLALAYAFSAPWLDAAGLRTVNKVCFWAFGLDWLVDYAATSRDDLDPLLARVAGVAAGDGPVDELTAFLVEVRDDLDAAAPHLREVWREELGLMLGGMSREWDWKRSGDLPDLDGYLANADNIGFSFVFTGHWIGTGGEGDVSAVIKASRAVQCVLRLLNDLGSIERDRKWGDLNALLLGVEEDVVRARLAELTVSAEELLAPLPPGLADYLQRQMEFCSGFYGVSDFWVAG